MNLMRHCWIGLTNLLIIAMIGVNLLQERQLAAFNPAMPWRPHVAPIAIMALLFVGMVFDWLSWMKAAWVINVGFYGIYSLAAGIEMLLTPNSHPGERGLALALLVIPFAIFAVLNAVLYSVRHRTTEVR